MGKLLSLSALKPKSVFRGSRVEPYTFTLARICKLCSKNSESFLIQLISWSGLKVGIIVQIFSKIAKLFSIQHSCIKMFLKPVWEGKIHGVTKIGIFRPLFCVNMLGKSTNYSTGIWPPCSTF